MAEPDFSDETLHFDATAFMGPGRAFILEGGPEVASTIRVGKRFERIGGRAVLIEAVEWAELPPLPGTEGGAALQRGSSATEVATGRRLPSRIVSGGPRQTAGLRRAFAPRGLVIDYELKSGTVSMFTFATGITYHITATFSVGTGSLTIQPGAILKFPRLSQVDFSGLLVCPASAGNEPLLTSMHDNRAGELIAGSTGYPAQGAWSYLSAYYPAYAPTVQNLVFRWAAIGVNFPSWAPMGQPTVINTRFESCGTAVSAAQSPTPVSPYLNNLKTCAVTTPYSAGTFFNGNGFTVDCAGDMDTTGWSIPGSC